MADPTPTNDTPGQPVWGGYLEGGERPRLAPVPNTVSGGTRKVRKPRNHQRAWDGSIDTYDLDDPNYDPDAWYTATHGADKSSRAINLRLPEYLAEALDQLAARRCFPAMRTAQDFIRSAVVHELHRRLGEIRDPDFQVQASAHTDLAEINAIRAENEAMKAFVVNCRDELSEVDGSPTRLRKVLDLVWAAMESGLYDGTLYRQLEDLSKKYWDDRGFAHNPRPVQ